MVKCTSRFSATRRTRSGSASSAIRRKALSAMRIAARASALRCLAARAAARPSTAIRVSARASNSLRLISGTRMARPGVTSSACSATSRFTASRTGITETPSAAALSRRDSLSPGPSWPEARSSESAA